MEPTITEVQAERMADAMVWKRLATDARYKHAEDAQAQAEREDEIEAEVWRELATKYGVASRYQS